MNEQHQLEERITFYGGLTTIGGVHILYSCGDTGIVFDLGMARAFFKGEVSVRSDFGIRSSLLTRMAPPVWGLYDPAFLGDVGEAELAQVWGRDHFPEVNNLHGFVSHIHQDHMALLPSLREGLPVWMHRDAYAVYEGVVAAGEYEGTKADIRLIEDGQIVDFGTFRLEFIEVDHDSPGVTGFIIHGPQHKIAFTADWRRHGRNSHRLDRFIERCQSAEVDLLITEGTRMRPDTLFRKPKDRLEVEVAVECRRAMEDTEGLVYVNILARNVERVADLIIRTKEAGRQLVMDESTAVLWKEASTRLSVLAGHPALDVDRDVIRLMSTPQWSKGPHPSKEVDLPYAPITLNEITANKSSYAVYLTYPNTPLIAEMETFGSRASASIYVHADGNPLTPSDETLLKWLTEFGVQYRYCATGGHASPQEISELTTRISPKLVVPLHSLHPTLFNSGGIRKYCPAPGESFELSELVGK
ncbi:MBL fold metallo-hydrolase [Paenibacillus chondroitinus]|uniref:MBL fold metallo-hydrolase n=1 Tax=Paenibacillus chondroitinus TaxID=59842 RepID=A0ABU6D7W1_9BACL|nr:MULTISPECIES: MBL fold metallo-hydrolase [Paenibacillus]MCY9661725.1 MBL fold metallo-hydrolase [Paenibacillus anseongense]MEB4793810.1 MBL fold metallo-hydrolase [Paenibacillus chondroitinus]